MDNCTIHTGEEVEKALKKKGAKLIYLSPYSPDFSPIENLWSKLKNILRSIKTTNYQELAKAIEFAFNEVTERKYLELVYSLLLLYLIFMRKAITKELVQKGHTVTVISSKPEKQKDIEALGATAAIGSLEDVDFLVSTFTGADAVYAMVPPDYTVSSPREYYRRIGSNYAQAIQPSSVKRVVYLSSYGAHLVDIHPALSVTGIPKPHDLGFCFITPAFGDLLSEGLTVVPQTLTASPAARIFLAAFTSLS